MSLSGSSDLEKLADLTSRTHKEQLVWFLNALWNTVGERDAENFWKYSLKCAELDLQNRERGSALDELNAHVFLEHFNETMTVRQMREQLRSTGAIGATERPKAVPISHILLFKYSADWHSVVNSTQGDNQDEIDEAQRRLNAAKAACDEAIAREAEAVAREAEAAQAKAELEAALADLHAQEDAYNTRTADLTARSETGGVVSRNKAKAELAQHLAEDPLPLRRAKLTTEAAVKKAERTRQAAEAARIEAVASRQAAEAAVQSADQYLQEVKSRSGSAQGAIWFMERELLEARKFLPTSKGGIAKGK